jgi:cytochrome c nitrite reductase small subunit
MDYLHVVMALGSVICILGILLALKTSRTVFDRVEEQDRQIHIGIAHIPAVAYAKIIAFLALIVLPAGAMFLANYHTFEGTHEVRGCAGCHVMLPMVNDMEDPNSSTLAARHFKNRWIAENQCFHCHSDYGLSGSLEAKMTGFRHLARYTTRTYHEPIRARTHFDNKNCLNCHGATARFEGVKSHQTAYAQLISNQMICLNCHGQAHPNSEQRTPGSTDYARLMGAIK